MSTTSDFLVADARVALRRRLSESCRTKLSRAFAAWLLREAERDAEFVSLVGEAATREGAQQDFRTVAILGFGADAGILDAVQIEVLKKGLRRQVGRAVVIDGLPVAFCFDAIGILGIAVGSKAVVDAELTRVVVTWVSKFLKNSADHSADWQGSLFAAADQQLGGSLNLSLAKSAATADVRTALVARGLIETGDDNQAAEDDEQTVKLAIREPQNELNCERAALRLAALESVIRAAEPMLGKRNAAPSHKPCRSLSDRDARVHDVIGSELFSTLTNAEIMRQATLKKPLRAEGLELGGEAAKRCLDRIRNAKGYVLSREIAKRRAIRN